MDTGKLVETRVIEDERHDPERRPRIDTVRLVEMGDVSVETKGMVKGLELGLTPKS